MTDAAMREEIVNRIKGLQGSMDFDGIFRVIEDEFAIMFENEEELRGFIELVLTA